MWIATFLLAALSSLPFTSAVDHQLEQFITYNFDLAPHQTDSFCFDARSDNIGYSTIFDQLRVEVKETGGNDFAWHSIKGISTDDFHAHIQHLVFKILGERGDQKDSKWLLEKHSFIRDILSSCPSPVNAKSLHSCSMRFSAFGRSCVSIFAERPLRVSIRASQHFHAQLLYNLFAGVILIALAPVFSKSKIFQYSVGSLAFVLGGGLIMILYLLMKLFPDRRNSSGTWIRDVFFGSLITTGYGASVVYYLRHNMRSLMLMYWEWVLGYMALFTLLGFLWVRSVRSSESSKAYVRSAVLWVIRSAGIIGIYNASASPMGSLVLLAVALTLYVLYAFNKHVLSQFQRKKQKEQ